MRWLFYSRRGRALTEKLGTFLESEELFLLLNLAAKLLFRRHICHILRGIELVAVVQDRIFRDGIVSVSTKQNANRRLVSFAPNQVVVHADIHIQLANILMSQTMGFQFENDKPFHLEIVEHQIDKEVVGLGNDMLLSLHKGKPAP